MNKQLAKTSTTLTKNMTNTETLTVDNITVLDKICIPVYTSPAVPTNPINGQFYRKKDLTNIALPYQFMINDNGNWH